MNASIEIQNGIKTLSGAPVDAKYYNNAGTAYADVAQVMSQISLALRGQGLTVNIAGVEYWWPTTDVTIDPVVKTPNLSGKANQSNETTLDPSDNISKIADVHLAVNATKAQTDADGNVITTTYETQTSAAGRITAIKDSVVPSGDTLKKLYDLITASYSEITVADIAARDAYNILSLPTNVFVLDDGDGKWALYKATTTGIGASYTKLSDADLFNAAMSASQIKLSYESNEDTNAFTDAYKDQLDSTTAIFTTALKTAYDTAYTHSQTAHAPSTAQANILEGIKVNGVTQTIDNKIVDLSIPAVPTKTSDLINDSGFITSGSLTPSTFISDIVVNLSNNRTIGKYITGQTIPSAGKTAEEVFRMVAIESIAPTTTLTTTTNAIYNSTSITNNLTFSYTINTPGATLQSGYPKLEWKRASDSVWTQITTGIVVGSVVGSTHNFTYVHTSTAISPIGSTNTDAFNYRYTIIDSDNLNSTSTSNVTIPTYAQPVLSGSLFSSTVETGNIVNSQTRTISKGSTNTTLTTYFIKYRLNNGTIINLNSPTAIPGNGIITVSLANATAGVEASINGVTIAGLKDASKIDVWVSINDTNNIGGTGTAGNVDRQIYSITTNYKTFYGQSASTTITENLIETLTGVILPAVRTGTYAFPATGYKYWCYPLSLGTSTLFKDQSNNLPAAMESVLTQSVTNAYFSTTTYNVHRTTNSLTGAITLIIT